MRVPFLDLAAHHEPVLAELQAAIARVISSGAFAGGPFVAAFEEQFALFCGTRFAAGVSSGTDALWLALRALGVGAGDEVITVPSTFIATVAAISNCGATPVLVDIDPVTYTLDPAALAGALTPRTKAIVPVHLFGQMADMDPILEFARAHRLSVVEDACQAHGARYKGRLAGSLGDAGCFSFYPGKNLGAFGEGGAVTTNHEGLLEQIKMLRDHGQREKYHHARLGWNCRLDGLQAAVLSVKLQRLEQLNGQRRAHAALYHRQLAEIAGVIRPLVAPGRESVHHVYAIRHPERDRLAASLKARGVETQRHYPKPVHLQEACRELGYRAGSFPVAEACADGFLSLPMYPELTPEQIGYVTDAVRHALSPEVSPALAAETLCLARA